MAVEAFWRHDRSGNDSSFCNNLLSLAELDVEAVCRLVPLIPRAQDSRLPAFGRWNTLVKLWLACANADRFPTLRTTIERVYVRALLSFEPGARAGLPRSADKSRAARAMANYHKNHGSKAQQKQFHARRTARHFARALCKRFRINASQYRKRFISCSTERKQPSPKKFCAVIEPKHSARYKPVNDAWFLKH